MTSQDLYLQQGPPGEFAQPGPEYPKQWNPGLNLMPKDRWEKEQTVKLMMDQLAMKRQQMDMEYLSMMAAEGQLQQVEEAELQAATQNDYAQQIQLMSANVPWSDMRLPETRNYYENQIARLKGQAPDMAPQIGELEKRAGQFSRASQTIAADEEMYRGQLEEGLKEGTLSKMMGGFLSGGVEAAFGVKPPSRIETMPHSTAATIAITRAAAEKAKKPIAMPYGMTHKPGDMGDLTEEEYKAVLSERFRKITKERLEKIPNMEQSTLEKIAHGAGETVGMVGGFTGAGWAGKQLAKQVGKKIISGVSKKALARIGAAGTASGWFGYGAAMPMTDSDKERFASLDEKDRPAAEAATRIDRGLTNLVIGPFMKIGEVFGNLAGKAGAITAESIMLPAGFQKVAHQLARPAGQAIGFPIAGELAGEAIGETRSAAFQRLIDVGMLAKPEGKGAVRRMLEALARDDVAKYSEALKEVSDEFGGGYAGWAIVNLIHGTHRMAGKHIRARMMVEMREARAKAAAEAKVISEEPEVAVELNKVLEKKVEDVTGDKAKAAEAEKQAELTEAAGTEEHAKELVEEGTKLKQAGLTETPKTFEQAKKEIAEPAEIPPEAPATVKEVAKEQKRVAAELVDVMKELSNPDLKPEEQEALSLRVEQLSDYKDKLDTARKNLSASKAKPSEVTKELAKAQETPPIEGVKEIQAVKELQKPDVQAGMEKQVLAEAKTPEGKKRAKTARVKKIIEPKVETVEAAKEEPHALQEQAPQKEAVAEKSALSDDYLSVLKARWERQRAEKPYLDSSKSFDSYLQVHEILAKERSSRSAILGSAQQGEGDDRPKPRRKPRKQGVSQSNFTEALFYGPDKATVVSVLTNDSSGSKIVDVTLDPRGDHDYYAVKRGGFTFRIHREALDKMLRKEASRAQGSPSRIGNELAHGPWEVLERPGGPKEAKINKELAAELTPGTVVELPAEGHVTDKTKITQVLDEAKGKIEVETSEGEIQRAELADVAERSIAVEPGPGPAEKAGGPAEPAGGDAGRVGPSEATKEAIHQAQTATPEHRTAKSVEAISAAARENLPLLRKAAGLEEGATVMDTPAAVGRLGTPKDSLRNEPAFIPKEEGDAAHTALNRRITRNADRLLAIVGHKLDEFSLPKFSSAPMAAVRAKAIEELATSSKNKDQRKFYTWLSEELKVKGSKLFRLGMDFGPEALFAYFKSHSQGSTSLTHSDGLETLRQTVDSLYGQLHEAIAKSVASNDWTHFKQFVDRNEPYLAGPISSAMRASKHGNKLLSDILGALYGEAPKGSAADPGVSGFIVIPSLRDMWRGLGLPMWQFASKSAKWLWGTVSWNDIYERIEKHYKPLDPTKDKGVLDKITGLVGMSQVGRALQFPTELLGHVATEMNKSLASAQKAASRVYDQWFGAKTGVMPSWFIREVNKQANGDVLPLDQLMWEAAQRKPGALQSFVKQVRDRQIDRRLLTALHRYMKERDTFRDMMASKSRFAAKLRRSIRWAATEAMHMHQNLATKLNEMRDSLAAMKGDPRFKRTGSALRALASKIRTTKSYDERRRLKQVFRKLASYEIDLVHSLGKLHPAEIRPVITSIKQSLGKVRKRIGVMNRDLTAYKEAWGREDYLTHLMNLEMDTNRAHQTYMQAMSMQGDLGMKAGLPWMLRRTGYLEESGQVLKSFARSVQHYIRTVPPVIEKIKAWEYLEKHLDTDLYPVRDGADSPFKPGELYHPDSAAEYLMNGIPGQVLGVFRLKLHPTLDAKGQPVFLKSFRELPDLGTPEAERRNKRIAQLRKRARVYAMLKRARASDEYEDAKSSFKPAEYVLFWTGQKGVLDRPPKDALMDVERVTGMMKRAKGGPAPLHMMPKDQAMGGGVKKFWGGFFELARLHRNGLYDKAQEVFKTWTDGIRDLQHKSNFQRALDNDVQGMKRYIGLTMRAIGRASLAAARGYLAWRVGALMGGALNLHTFQTIALSGALTTAVSIGPLAATRGLGTALYWQMRKRRARKQITGENMKGTPLMTTEFWDNRLAEAMKPTAEELKKHPDRQFEWEWMQFAHQNGVLQHKGIPIPSLYELGLAGTDKRYAKIGQTQKATMRGAFDKYFWFWVERADWLTRMPLGMEVYKHYRKAGMEKVDAERRAFRAIEDTQGVFTRVSRPTFWNALAGQMQGSLSLWPHYWASKLLTQPRTMLRHAGWSFGVIAALAHMTGRDTTKLFVGDLSELNVPGVISGPAINAKLAGVGTPKEGDPAGIRPDPIGLASLIKGRPSYDMPLPVPMPHMVGAAVQPIPNLFNALTALSEGSWETARQGLKRFAQDMTPHDVRLIQKMLAMSPSGAGEYLLHNVVTGRGSQFVPYDMEGVLASHLGAGQSSYLAQLYERQMIQRAAHEYRERKSSELNLLGENWGKLMFEKQEKGAAWTEAEQRLLEGKAQEAFKLAKDLGSPLEMTRLKNWIKEAERNRKLDIFRRTMLNPSYTKAERANVLIQALEDPIYARGFQAEELTSVLKQMFGKGGPTEWLKDLPADQRKRFVEAIGKWRSVQDLAK